VATQLFTPAFCQHVKRARELNDREPKDVYYHPTEDRIVKKSIDLSSPKPMGEIGTTAEYSSEERWLEAYLIRQAKRNNWMLQFGEKQYRVLYSRGRRIRNRLRYAPCGGREYRALYSRDGGKQRDIHYVPCGSGQYKAQYSEDGDGQNGISYAPCTGRQYRALYPENGEHQGGLRYFQCGQKQYRLLSCHLKFRKEGRGQADKNGALDLLLYDEDTRNLVILELRSKRALNGAKEALDSYSRMVVQCKAGLKKAFDLDEIRGVVSYIVWPANGRRNNGANSVAHLGKYGLIEYTRIPKPWEAFKEARKQGEDLEVKLTCRKPAQRVPLG
jgi:hypothetical protein